MRGEEVEIDPNAKIGIKVPTLAVSLQRAGTRRDKARKLVQDLETRGSRAFPLFLVCLEGTGQHSLSELLRSGTPAVRLQTATPSQVVLPAVLPVVLPLPLCKCVMMLRYI